MIYFVDVEASSLSVGGFPIEVAWVDEHGQGESHLIRPADAWLHPPSGLLEWSPASERVHGIGMEMLLADGEPHDHVARRVAGILGRPNAMPCSDAPRFDARWLRMLLEAVGLKGALVLVDIQQIYGWACRPLLKRFADKAAGAGAPGRPTAAAPHRRGCH